MQNAIRAAGTAPAAQDEAPAATGMHAVYHPDRDAAPTPAQRAAAVHAHQQVAVPEQLEGRTTDPATWMRTPESLARFVAYKREADARRRAITDRPQPEQEATDATGPADQQHHTTRPDQGRGVGRDH
ncbi:hypothetical protein [Streptomyces sp. NPDC060027]|uniref:hypothetical protein n=1 Tax=Streptomyces sp. NPDC060027 TaxID=3347040 RepID=UPI0036C88233